jgi:membrane protein YqaA with SNARE-associated domain
MVSSSSVRRWLQLLTARCFTWLLRHGQRPYAIWSLSALSILDGVLPMMPAELLALALMILQPRRVVLVALAFAVSAAISAGLLATLVAGIAQATSWSGWLEAERQGAGWLKAVSLIQAWGAPALAMAAAFPDSPRAVITVSVLAGLSPINITGFVLVGKLLLYTLLVLVVRYMPARWPGLAAASWPGARTLRRSLQRFAYFRRWVHRRVVQHNTDRRE